MPLHELTGTLGAQIHDELEGPRDVLCDFGARWICR